MPILKVPGPLPSDHLEFLSKACNGSLKVANEDCVLKLSTDEARGEIRLSEPEPGLRVMLYEATFDRELQLEYHCGSDTTLEFLYMSEGCAQYRESGGQPPQTIRQNQNVILFSNHPGGRTLVFPADQRFRLLHITFDPHAAGNAIIGKSLTRFCEYLKASGNLVHYGDFNLQLREEVCGLKECSGSGAVRDLLFRGRLSLILALQIQQLYLFREVPDLPGNLSNMDLDNIRAASRHIETHLATPLTIRKLEKVSGLSSRKLHLGFNLLYSSSVNDYIRARKLEAARELLRTTNLEIPEIAYRIGIRSRSYFSRIFRETYGVLPAAYRNQLGK